jgi:DNA-binding CsgD family transcriptional regulator
MLRQTERTVRTDATLEQPFLSATPVAIALRQSVSRGRGFPGPLADAIVGEVDATQVVKLSPRETECLAWTAQGKTTWEIAQILELSDSTVNYYIRNAMKKLAVHTKAHAVSKAAVLGMFG